MSAIISASSFVSLTVGFTVSPPRFAFVSVTSAGRSFRRHVAEPDRRAPALLDRVARTAAAPLEASRLLLVLEPRQLGLQPPDVVLGRLVVWRLLDLVLDRLDLFLDRHAMRNRAGRTTKNLSTPALRGLSATRRCECPRAPGL